MNESYTSGPWVWFYRDRLYQDRADSAPTVLAAHGGGEVFVSDADANLIAAAPDLLAALEGVTSSLELMLSGDDVDYDFVREVDLVNAWRAIAAAKGETI